MSSDRKRGTTEQVRWDAARVVSKWSVEDFRNHLKEHDFERGFVLFENGEFTVSHPAALAPLRAFFELSPQFAGHEAVFVGRHGDIPTVFFAFIHDTRRGLAQGGARFMAYPSLAATLVDGLELSRAMTRKNALAGLWWGGGKAVIPLPPGYTKANPPDGEERDELFAAFGLFIASLNGVYYTAEDVGTKTHDMDVVLRNNRFTTCISREFGGSGNPSPFTAKGVLLGMSAGWQVVTGSPSLRDVRVGVQGAGNVGLPLIGLLVEAGAQVLVTDYDDVLEDVRDRFPQVEVVSTDQADQFFGADLDIVAPCAVGETINSETIPLLKARLVCGAANNPLREPADAGRLLDAGITFVPDYVVNRMGITNCADEWMGYLPEDIEVATERIFPDTLRVLKHANDLLKNPKEAADELADIAAGELHPLLGHRGRRITDDLVASRWHEWSSEPEEDAGEDEEDAGEDEEEAKRLPGRVRRRYFIPAVHERAIRLRWEREGRFRGSGRSVAAASVSAASNPTLATVLPAVFMDIRARALEAAGEPEPRRVIGSDPGGLALQHAVERSLSLGREEVGRSGFLERCRDRYNTNDASIREQLHLLGVGFDPSEWVDPVGAEGREACYALFGALETADLLEREERSSYWCPRCETIQVQRDLDRDIVDRTSRFAISFRTSRGAEIRTTTFFPELVVGAAGVGVDAEGPHASLVGETVENPFDGSALPIVAISHGGDPQLLVPAHDPDDAAVMAGAGVTEFPQVYDRIGRVVLPDVGALPVDEARKVVIDRLGTALDREVGRWSLDVLRCGRCGTMIISLLRDQLLVRTDLGAGQLIRGIENGSVVVSGRRWHDEVIRDAAQQNGWVISRQEWWGHEILDSSPADQVEVFSRWFAMVATTMRSLGWPSDLRPIDEVFTDPDNLTRWVMPAQSVAYALTGRPAFRRIQVLGSLQTVERELRPVAPSADAVETDRWAHTTVRRPVRVGDGRSVQPAALVRRFGADSLRLGYLLSAMQGSADGAGDLITLSESRLRSARRAVHRLVGKTTGLFDLAAEDEWGSDLNLLDRWIVARCRVAGDAARDASDDLRIPDVGVHFVNTVDAFARYTELVARRRREGDFVGAPGPAGAAALRLLGPAFGPVCPFLFEQLSLWLPEKTPQWADHGWDHSHATNDDKELCRLITRLDEQSAKVRKASTESTPPRLHASSADLGKLSTLKLEQRDLERMVRMPLLVGGRPPTNRAQWGVEVWVDPDARGDARARRARP